MYETGLLRQHLYPVSLHVSWLCNKPCTGLNGSQLNITKESWHYSHASHRSKHVILFYADIAKFCVCAVKAAAHYCMIETVLSCTQWTQTSNIMPDSLIKCSKGVNVEFFSAA